MLDFLGPCSKPSKIFSGLCLHGGGSGAGTGLPLLWNCPCPDQNRRPSPTVAASLGALSSSVVYLPRSRQTLVSAGSGDVALRATLSLTQVGIVGRSMERLLPTAAMMPEPQHPSDVELRASRSRRDRQHQHPADVLPGRLLTASAPAERLALVGLVVV